MDYRNKLAFKSGYKYVLQQNCTFNLLRLGGFFLPDFQHKFFDCLDNRVSVYANYAWDGPSGPTLDTKNFMAPSLLHDVLYQAIREGLLEGSYRSIADDLLYSALRAEGMSAVRAWYTHQAVRRFGLSAATTSRETKVV